MKKQKARKWYIPANLCNVCKGCRGSWSKQEGKVVWTPCKQCKETGIFKQI